MIGEFAAGHVADMQFDAIGRWRVALRRYRHGVRRVGHAVTAARVVAQDDFDVLPRVEFKGRSGGQLQHDFFHIGGALFDAEDTGG